MNNETPQWDSLWRGIIGLEIKAHQAWYNRGRTGEGRMVLVDENLQGARVADLRGGSFTRCDLSGAELGRQLLDDTEMTDCLFFDASLNYSSWNRAKLTRCNFAAVFMGSTGFDDAVIDNCDWTGAYIERAIWRRSHICNSTFSGVYAHDQLFDGAVVENCNFRGADLQRKMDLEMGKCPNARFTDCDFRNANLTGLRLNNTTFERCRFHGVIGTPALEGPVTIIDADFSAAGDKSDLRSQAEVIALWTRNI